MNVANVTVLTANSSGLTYVPTGNVNINIGGANANLTMNLLTANGIKFPATQVTSADANTLDDYEEGTWTPAINFAGGTTGITYGLRQGFYTKVGNMVYATCLINLSNKGSSTGAFRIGGLPFTTNSDSNYRATSMSMLWDGLSTNYVYMYGLVTTSVVAMDILGATAATNSNGTSVTNTNLSGSDNFRISIAYQI
jgi:hypothetical protein